MGLNHGHIYGQVNCLLAAGAELVAFHSPEDELARSFSAKYPGVKRVGDRAAILEDRSIHLVVTAAILDERAGIAIEAMRHGKDVMSDKPGMISHAQLDAIRSVQAETGHIYSVCYSEHFETRSTVKAGELVKAGAIGEVIHTVGLGPHAIHNGQRPDWFFDRRRYGGILCDIGSHQCEQFLFFTGTLDAEVASATVANRGNPDRPGLRQTPARMAELYAEFFAGVGEDAAAPLARTISVTPFTYYRWRKEFGGLKSDQVKRLKNWRKRTSGCARRLRRRR